VSPLPSAAEACLQQAQAAATRQWLLETWGKASGLLTGIPATVLQAESRSFWLQLAQSFARPRQSGFSVGAIAVDTDGNGYPGANCEWPERGLQQTIHAEQSAVLNAWMSGASGISELWVSALPCGHCRQFLQEIPQPEKLRIIVASESERSFTLADLLPHPFRLTPTYPTAWGHVFPEYPQLTPTEESEAWWQSVRLQAKGTYSGEATVVVLSHPQTTATVVGVAFESAAYNPGISAETAALSRWEWTPLRDDKPLQSEILKR
jgi:cytidine deaminase